MKLKNLKIPNKIKKLNSKIKELSLDMEGFINEHDSYVLDTEVEVAKWISSLPIESLNEFIRYERKLPRLKLSLQDLKVKNDLKKCYYKIKNELENNISELTLAKIEYIEKQISNIV